MAGDHQKRAMHLNCKSNHGTCCACHTDTQYRRMQRNKEAANAQR